MGNFFYSRYVGRYKAKTGHLTMLQDGAYGRLMDYYYETGKPIPEESDQIIRISRAHSVDEIEAVSCVLKEFFKLRSGKWHNRTIDEELVRMRQLSKLRSDSARRRWDDKRNAKAHANASQESIQNASDLKTLLPNTNTKVKSKSKSKSIRAHFSIPSMGEVTAYCQERNRGVDPQKWFNHYTANGWKVGPNAMKDWRAAVRTWEKNGYERPNSNRPEPTRPVSAQVARFHNNLAEVQRTFGAAASMGGTVDSSSTRQTPRLSSGDTPALEGEVAGVQKLGN